MDAIQEKISQAKAAGYTDDQIADHLGSSPDFGPKIKAATAAGYKSADIIGHLSGGPAAKPADEPGVLKSFGAGLGKGLGEVVLGAQGLVGKGLQKLGETVTPDAQTLSGLITGKKDRGLIQSAGDWLANDAESGRARLTSELAPYKAANPLSTGAGEVGGNIVATLPVGGVLAGGMMKAAPTLVRAGASAPVVEGLANSLATSGFRAGATTGATNMLARTAGGAVTGGVSSALVNPDSAGMGAAIGGLLPGATKVAGMAGSAMRNGLAGSTVAPEVSALARRAAELGVDIPADRIANSKPLNALAASLNYVPLSGRAATEKGMESGLNKALSRTFGQDSDNVTMALRKADDQLGAKFESVLKNNKVNVDDALMARLGEIEQTADRELGADGMKAIKGQITELLDKGASGQIDGQAAYNIKRTLDRIGRRNTPEAFHAREMKGALMEALDRSIGPEQAAAFATTRKQYGNMLALERLAKNGAEGDISVARLANMKNINNADLQELADIAAQFVKPREGQHGAMQRAMVGGVGATGLLNGALPGAGLVAGAAAGRGTNMLLNSNLLKQALMNGPAPASEGVNRLLQGAFRVAPVIPAR